MDDASTPEAGAANHDGETSWLEPDPDLALLANRAVAAGLTGVWTRFKDPGTGKFEGPTNLKLEMPSGRRVRALRLDADHAKALLSFKFERWTVLREYQAILDTDKRVIVAEVSLSGRPSLGKLPGATKNSLEKDEPEMPYTSCLIIPAADSDLSLELYTHCPPEIAALKGRRLLAGNGLTIHGVATTRHDEALELLIDLSTSLFIDLDIAYGLTGSLVKAYDADLVAQVGYDPDRPSVASPRFPSTRHDRDAASLYLYAREVNGMPLLEYLVYYQVIEFYLPTYTRSATIGRLRNILKDPGFDYNNDLALGRVLDAIAPAGRKVMNEREQVAATIASCVDDTAIAAFLDDRPAAAKALADKTRIRDVRMISLRDRQTSLVSQVAERIYDLRCRIVHSKENGGEAAPPIRPFDRESRMMRHDLSLIRFVAQRVLIASSRPASW